jgi:hypothetical protein
MKKLFFLPLLVIFLISCKKENTSFLSKYQAISGTWNLQSFSYDSSGVKIIKSSPYNRLVIKNNLEYHIYMDLINPIENGTINIITQTNDKLELYFAAQYPAYSSYAGSHIFGFTNVELVSISDNEMIIKTINAGNAQYSDKEIIFKK